MKYLFSVALLEIGFRISHKIELKTQFCKDRDRKGKPIFAAFLSFSYMFLHTFLMLKIHWKWQGETPKKELKNRRLVPGYLYLKTLKLYALQVWANISLFTEMSAFLINKVAFTARKSQLQPPSKSCVLMKEVFTHIKRARVIYFFKKLSLPRVFARELLF